MFPNWNNWNWKIWKIWKKVILSRAKRTTAKPFLSQANQDWRREEQIGSPGLRFEEHSSCSAQPSALVGKDNHYPRETRGEGEETDS